MPQALCVNDDFGIIGVGDETAKFIEAVNAADGKVLDGGGLTITLSEQLTTTTSLTLTNCTLNFTNTGYGWVPQGDLDEPFTPSGSLAKGNTSIAFASAPGFQAGDLLFIRSSDAWATATGDGEVISQWARVESISGSTVNLDAPLDYTFTSDICVYRPITLNRITLQNVGFTGLGLDNSQILFFPQYCRDLSMFNVRGANSGSAAFEFLTCYGVKGFGCDASHVMSDGTGYGFAVQGGTENVHFFGTTGENTRHLVTLGGITGVNRNCHFHGVHGAGSRDAIADSHASADMFSFLDVSGSVMSANLETVVVQGARSKVTTGTIVGTQGGVIIQPMTNLENDHHEVDCTSLTYETGTAAKLLSFENKKSAGSIDFLSFKVKGRNLKSTGPGVQIRNSATTDVNSFDLDANIRTGGYPLAISNTSTGKIKNGRITGLIERTNSDARVLQLSASNTGDIDNIQINGRLIGGDYSIQNIGNKATNVSANMSLLTGYGTAALYPTANAVSPSPSSGTTVAVTSQFNKTSDATLANITGLSAQVEAGGIYKFRAMLSVTAGAAGGVQAAIGGTATHTTITANGKTFNGTTVGANTTATASGTAVGAYTGVATDMVIEGYTKVNAAGTLTVQFAQNVSNGTASSVKVGSIFEVTRIA